MINVLVTGAGGFVGRATAKRLVDSGLGVRCAVRRLPEKHLAGETVVIGGIEKGTEWDKQLRGVETIVHLASRVHVLDEKNSDPRAAFFEINVTATERLARAAAAQGVRRFVFLSSVGVHGAISTKPLVETDFIRPWNPYTESKWVAEQTLRQVEKETGLEVVTIRAPLIYGAHVRGNFRRLLAYVDKEFPLPLANAHNSRSLVGLDNIVDLIVCCVRHPKAAGEVFLVADGDDISTKALVQQLAALLGRRTRLFPVPLAGLQWAAKVLHKENLVQRLYGSLTIDAAKASRMLGWAPPVRLEKGLEQVAHWYREEHRSRAK